MTEDQIVDTLRVPFWPDDGGVWAPSARVPFMPWSGHPPAQPPTPTDNRGVWAKHPAMRAALDRLGAAIGQIVDMHREGNRWRLRHGTMDLAGACPSFWHALRAGLEDIADVVGFDEPWAKPELLDALSEAYAWAGGRWWLVMPKDREPEQVRA